MDKKRYVSVWNLIPRPLINPLWVIPLYLIWGAIGYFFLGYSITSMITFLIEFSVVIWLVFSILAFLINFNIWKGDKKPKTKIVITCIVIALGLFIVGFLTWNVLWFIGGILLCFIGFYFS